MFTAEVARLQEANLLDPAQSTGRRDPFAVTPSTLRVPRVPRAPRVPRGAAASEPKPANPRAAKGSLAHRVAQESRAPPKVRLLFGSVQSGKTAGMLDNIMATPEGHLCAVIVRNVQTDAAQFAKACRDRNIPHYHFSSKQELNKHVNPLTRPKVMILLANQFNLRKFREAVIQDSAPDFTMFVDEGDKIMNSNDPGEKSLRTEIDRVMEFAVELVLVTATPLNLACLPEFGSKMSADDVQVLPHRANYCSVDHINFGTGTLDAPSTIDEDYIPEDEQSPDITEQLPGSYRTWLRGLVDDSDGSSATLSEIGQSKFALARMGNYLGSIFMSAKEVLKYRGLLPVVLVGEGVCLTPAVFKALAERGFDVKHSALKKCRDFRAVKNVNVTFPILMTMLKKSGLIDESSAVVVLSGVISGRGVNFVDSTFSMSLSHEYVLLSKSTDGAESVQAMRLLGVKPYDITKFRPVLTTKRSTLDNIAATLHVQEHAVDLLKNGGFADLRSALSTVMVPEKPHVKYAPNLSVLSIPEGESLWKRKRDDMV